MCNAVEKLFLNYYSVIVQMVLWVFPVWLAVAKPQLRTESVQCVAAYVLAGIFPTGLGICLPIVSRAVADFSDLITGQTSEEPIKMPLLVNAIIAVIMWGVSTAIYYY